MERSDIRDTSTQGSSRISLRSIRATASVARTERSGMRGMSEHLARCASSELRFRPLPGSRSLTMLFLKSQGFHRRSRMCRNIKTLFNFEPPATEDEVRASALQFVRKLSGFNKPSQANEASFALAVEEVSAAAHKLLSSLHTHAPARDREIEVEKARARARERFA